MGPGSDTLKARPYQTQILEVALRQNAIIYLPTGSGKTYIAILAMKKMSQALEKPLSQGGKRSVFLTNTVALARQQYECIKNLVNLKVTHYTGDMNVDNWKREKWRAEFDEYQVVVATTQIILDVVRHGFLSITDFNLMIFDECHHANNDHPMSQLMGHFKNQPAHLLPRIIGLTGLLLKSTSPVNIEDDLNKMEATFRATIVTVSDSAEYANVLVYSTKPSEKILRYHESPSRESICGKITSLVDECTKRIGRWDLDNMQLQPTKNLESYRAANPIKKHKNFYNDFLHKMEDMGIYGASIAILSILVEFELKKRAAETVAIRQMSRLCISSAERIRHELVAYMKANSDYTEDDENELHEMIYDNSSQKIQSFLGFLEMTFKGKNPKEISCLVFVERRQTAKCLFYLVKHFVESKKTIPIIPEFMVGGSRAMPESIESWLESKRHKNVLRKFKKGECNMMIASSVLEEGIDVQSCNYVIMYDTIKHFSAYVQTKGRARMQSSSYTIMIEEKEISKLLGKLEKWKKIEDQLQKYLIGKTVERHLPLEDEINERFPVTIKPFYTKIGAVLEASSVVQLLNRYCMALPQDLYTASTVCWFKETTDSKIVVRLVMPPQSTIKEDIISDKVGTVKDAKRSAAMKACIRLYENKELNEHLLPISKTNCFELVDNIYFEHWKEFSTDDPRLAGTKYRRTHVNQYPDQLSGATPKVGKVSYLYSIELTPCFPRDDSNQYVLDLLGMSSSFAFFTSKELPPLAKMPLFMSQGQITAAVNSNPTQTTICSDEEISALRGFHVMLFRDLLETWHGFFASNFENKENSFLIVPTKNGNTIDWELVKRCQSLQKPRELTELQRKKLDLDPREYENSVVCPWYSSSQRDRYVVTKVLMDMNPWSPFPNGEYQDFASYFKDKYNQNVVKGNQFMLLVKPMTRERNLTRPGMGVAGGRNKSKRLQEMLLVPELCHNFCFPGDLWFKALFLPSVLHRVHYLLLAENLRTQINGFLGIESKNDPLDTLKVENLKQAELAEDESMDVEDGESDGCLKKGPQHVGKVDIMDPQCHWEEYKEPVDIERKMDELYEIELDYYVQFLNTAMEALSNEKHNDKVSGNNSVKMPKLSAICDRPSNNSYTIEFLQNVSALSQSDLLMAITRKSAGDAFDMERLELLGDSFLKFSVSFYLLDQHMAWNEGCLTALKGRLVSNRNLCYHAIQLGLPGMLVTTPFNGNDLQPPLVSVPVKIQEAMNVTGVSPFMLCQLALDNDEVNSGIVKEKTLSDFIRSFQQEPFQESTFITMLGKRFVSDKACADSLEAILGVCVKNLGVERSFAMLNFFGICPKDPSKNITELMRRISYTPRLKPDIKDAAIDSYLVNYKELEEHLGYKFKDRAYLLQALTHPSCISNRLTGCYQVLEFLGDAVLDFLVSSYIFERCSHMGPGELTDLRSALVNNSFLACLTVRYKFHAFLLSESASLMKAIEQFVRFQSSEHNKITDQVRILIQEEECSMADYVDVPKALGDIFESLVGAVFLDSGNSLERTWSVIYNLMSEEIGEYVQKVPKQLVRQLYEYPGANPKFQEPLVEDGIVMVKCQFTHRGVLCEVNGFGSNKEGAKISAAKLALQTLANK